MYSPSIIEYPGLKTTSVKGENAEDIYVDLVGAYDTPFRWAYDQVGAAASRFAVLPQTIMRQVQGKTFEGEPFNIDDIDPSLPLSREGLERSGFFDDVLDPGMSEPAKKDAIDAAVNAINMIRRAVQFSKDLGLPIVGNAILKMVETEIPGLDPYVPGGQERMGTAGLAARITAGMFMNPARGEEYLDTMVQEAKIKADKGERWEDKLLAESFYDD